MHLLKVEFVLIYCDLKFLLWPVEVLPDPRGSGPGSWTRVWIQIKLSVHLNVSEIKAHVTGAAGRCCFCFCF